MDRTRHPPPPSPGPKDTPGRVGDHMLSAALPRADGPAGAHTKPAGDCRDFVGALATAPLMPSVGDGKQPVPTSRPRHRQSPTNPRQFPTNRYPSTAGLSSQQPGGLFLGCLEIFQKDQKKIPKNIPQNFQKKVQKSPGPPKDDPGRAVPMCKTHTFGGCDLRRVAALLSGI